MMIECPFLRAHCVGVMEVLGVDMRVLQVLRRCLV